MKNKKEELQERIEEARIAMDLALKEGIDDEWADRKSTRLNSSHL